MASAQPVPGLYLVLSLQQVISLSRAAAAAHASLASAASFVQSLYELHDIVRMLARSAKRN